MWVSRVGPWSPRAPLLTLSFLLATGQGIYAQQIQDLFAVQRRRAGLAAPNRGLSTDHFRRPGDAQLDLFAG